VGFIGGKTQTDIGAMDDLYLDGKIPFASIFLSCVVINYCGGYTALGIADEVERLGLKGSKKKKGKKLDEDYMVSNAQSSGHRQLSLSYLPSLHSLTLSRSWRKTYPKSSRQCDKLRAARSYTNY
jgi:hypothetical protein